MHRNGYLWAPGKNSDTDVRFLDPSFLTKNVILAIWWRFRLIFALDNLNVCYNSTSGLDDLMTWKMCYLSPQMMKISTKFEVDMTIRCLVILFLLLIRYVTLILTFVIGHIWQVTYSTPPPSLNRVMWQTFTTVECRISSRLKWYKNYKNRLRLAIVRQK